LGCCRRLPFTWRRRRLGCLRSWAVHWSPPQHTRWCGSLPIQLN